MSQLNWVYVDDYGKKNRVGIFHGNRTGHVLIHCNAKVMVIDFSVNESKMYSFFIEDELCEIEIEKMPDGRFGYSFEINKEVDTPRNRERKRLDKKYMWQTFLFFGGILLLVAIFMLAFNYFKEVRKEELTETILIDHGKYSTARFFETEDPTIYRYAFIGNDQVIERTISFDKIEPPLPFPIQTNDEFPVQYLLSNPVMHQIHFDSILPKQRTRYEDLAIQKELSLHSNIDETMARCRVNLAFQRKGIEGIANFYYQDVPPSKDQVLNENTYLRMVRAIDFQQTSREECGY